MAEFDLPNLGVHPVSEPEQKPERTTVAQATVSHYDRAVELGIQLPPAVQRKHAKARAKLNLPEFLAPQPAAELNMAQEEARRLPAPEQAAQIREAAKANGVPFLAALEAPEQEGQAKELPWDVFENNGPVSRILLDPEYMPLARDVVHDLARAADTINNPFPETRLGLEVERGENAIRRNEINFKRWANGGAVTPEDDAVLTRLKQRDAILPMPLSFAGEVVSGAAGQIPIFTGMAKRAAAGAVAAGAVGLAAGPGGAGAFAPVGATVGVASFTGEQSVGDAYGEYRDAGMPHEVAHPLALIVGAGVAALDTFSAGMLLKIPGLKALAGKLKDVPKPALTAAVKAAMKDARFVKLLGEVAKGSGVEAGTESMQEVLQILGNYVGADQMPEGEVAVPTFDEAVNRTLVAASVGGLVGGGVNAITSVAQDTLVRANMGEKVRSVIDSIYIATEKDPLSERAPDVSKKYWDAVGTEKGVLTVSVPAEELTKILDANKDSPKLQAWLKDPNTARRISEAATTGAPVMMTLGDFVSNVRPLDKSGALKDFISINDEPTPTESKELLEHVKKARKEMADIARRKELQGPEGAVYSDMLDKIRAGVKSSREAAHVQATLFAAGLEGISRKVGKSAWEIYKERPVAVERIGDASPNANVEGTFEDADPAGVKVLDQGDSLLYKHPESLIRLRIYRDEVAGQRVRVAAHQFLLGGETKEAIESEKGKGYSTAIYLRALADAKAANEGWASDTGRTDATRDMYARLARIGVPTTLVKMDERGISDRFMLTAEELQKIDLEAAWQRLLEDARKKAGTPYTAAEMAGKTDEKRYTAEEVDALVAGLTEFKNMVAGQARGFITFDKELKEFKIHLTKSESLATFLHETAHYFLLVMEAYENTSPEIAEEMNVLREWAGLQPGQKFTTSVKAHEMFARGFEVYLAEGKAPSARLERVFSIAKAWILRVYRSIKALIATDPRIGKDFQLSDEVREVFDRLLATDEEIDIARVKNGYFPNAAIIKMGMTEQEVAVYQRQYEQGADRAQRQIDLEAIRAIKKEKSEVYDRIVADVEKKLDNHPALSLRSFLTTAKRTDEGLEIPQALVGKKLDRAAVKAVLQAEPGLASKLREVTVEQGGVDPAELAPYFRFKSEKEMLVSLAQTPARQTLRNAEIKAGMKEVFPAYGVDKAWAEREAIMRLKGSDAIASALETELRVIHSKAGLQPPVSPARVAELAAIQHVRQMTEEELEPARFDAAEQAALRRQQKALAEGDLQTAASATRARLFSRAMRIATAQAQEEVDKAHKYIARFTRIETLGRLGKSHPELGPIIRDAAASIVESLGMRSKTDASSKSLDTYARTLESAGLPVAIEPALRENAIPEWEALSVQSIFQVRKALTNLSHIAASLDKVRLGEESIKLDNLADSLEETLKSAGLWEHAGQRGEQNSTLRRLRAETAKPETILRALEGGDLGPVTRFWMGTAEAGQFERDRRFRQRRADLHKLHAKYSPKGWAKLMKQSFEYKGKTYTGANVFTMLLNLGSESNRYKLVEGMNKAGLNWDYESLVKFIHTVFPEQSAYDYAQALLTYISSSNLWEDSARVQEMISGVRPDKVEPLAIPTPSGQSIEGGYYPLVYDRNVPLTEVEIGLDALEAMNEANPLNLYAANGFTKDRTGYVAPIMLDPRALAAHLYEVDHFISNAQGIIDRHKFLSHPRVKGAIIRSLGHEYWDTLKGSNNYIAQDARALTRETLQAVSLVEKAVYHNALLSMGGNLLSAVNQVVTGLPSTVAYLGPKGLPAFAKSLLKFTRNPFAMWERVLEASGEIKGMDFHYDRDLRLIVARELTGETWDSVRSQIAATTMAPLVFMQKAVNVVTWEAAFDIAINQGQTNAEAVQYANSAVRQSQSTSAPKDFTQVQRSRDSFMRILTTLASYTFTLNDLVMPLKLTPKQLAGATMRLSMLVFTSMLAKAAMDALFPRLEEKDSEVRTGISKTAEESEIFGLLYLTESLLDVMGNVPVVGRLAQGVVEGRTPRFATWVETGTRALQSAPDAFEDRGLSEAQLRAVTETVGLVVGVPTRHILFGTGESMFALVNGEIEGTPWDFFQELALARPGQRGER